MSPFTKLDSSIIESSIWVEDDATLRVWIALLASCNADGFVAGSVPGFASKARVTVEQMIAAIDKFSSPDPHSRTPDNDGRRIEALEGGWVVLNYAKYREKHDPEERRRQVREAVRRHRAKKGNQRVIKNDYQGLQQPDVINGNHKKEERGKKSDTKALSGKARRRGKDQPHPPEVLVATRSVIGHLNAVTASNYSPTAEGNLKLIARLLNDGATVEQMMGVVDGQAKRWKGRTDMQDYLRPATLFGADNFWTKYAGHVDGSSGKPKLTREERVNENRL